MVESRLINVEGGKFNVDRTLTIHGNTETPNVDRTLGQGESPGTIAGGRGIEGNKDGGTGGKFGTGVLLGIDGEVPRGPHRSIPLHHGR